MRENLKMTFETFWSYQKLIHFKLIWYLELNTKQKNLGYAKKIKQWTMAHKNIRRKINFSVDILSI